ncbi:hypothetical protein [Pannonibacter phragmitetus]|uniref:hypothetical protein n=1 Tax=Pannonibacter phragmitetus TaxID=121719 RepID=UPI00197FED93|nr:hypothetical protein [Pannonibacter phragmitetus]
MAASFLQLSTARSVSHFSSEGSGHKLPDDLSNFGLDLPMVGGRTILLDTRFVNARRQK